MSRTLFIKACMLLVTSLLLGGCSTTPRPSAEAVWPTEWDGRKPFNTDYAIVYARDESAVRDVERLVAAVMKEVSSQEGTTLQKGLIILTDAEDSSIGSLDLQTLQVSTLIPEEIRGLKIERREMILASPHELTAEQLTGPLGFSSESTTSVAWSIALPSQQRLKQTSRHLMEATAANPELGMTERALITAFLPMFADCVADTIDGARGEAIKQQLLRTAP